MKEHLYSIETANHLLPWLEQQFKNLRMVNGDLANHKKTLADLLRNRGNNGHSSSEEVILSTREVVDRLTANMQEVLKGIDDLGILVRNIEMGLVDFPAERDGRLIYLCWISGENTVAFWHETNVGFTDRQSL
ncbi:DUF2203 domain-containing protein [Dehalococcoidia bacterium]|nr:DUF2203 domain-containing protein [Dehalococcoidia bacterium]|tara:strand:+ start:606 stop:1004 length:399 start_codon:yes stop_codon:yes gene_type:complete